MKQGGAVLLRGSIVLLVRGSCNAAGVLFAAASSVHAAGALGGAAVAGQRRLVGLLLDLRGGGGGAKERGVRGGWAVRAAPLGRLSRTSTAAQQHRLPPPALQPAAHQVVVAELLVLLDVAPRKDAHALGACGRRRAWGGSGVGRPGSEQRQGVQLVQRRRAAEPSAPARTHSSSRCAAATRSTPASARSTHPCPHRASSPCSAPAPTSSAHCAAPSTAPPQHTHPCPHRAAPWCSSWGRTSG